MDGGWESLGDMGWLDDDGYLYLGDRMTDMILTGGSPTSTRPRSRRPSVSTRACAPAPSSACPTTTSATASTPSSRPTTIELDVDELLAFLGDRLVRYKVPRSVEVVDQPLRDDAGKVRRGALRAERIP